MIEGIDGSSNDVKDYEEDLYRIESRNNNKCKDAGSWYKFIVPSGYTRNCAFIARNKKTKMYHCNKKYDDRGKVKKFCKKTCGECDCEDDEDFTFKKGKNFKCKVLYFWYDERYDRYDKFCSWPNVQEGCPKACGKCP